MHKKNSSLHSLDEEPDTKGMAFIWRVVSDGGSHQRTICTAVCIFRLSIPLWRERFQKAEKKKRLAIHVVIISNLFMSATRHCLAYTHEYYLYSMRICVMCLCSTLALWFAIVAHSLLIYMSGVPVCMRHGDTNTSSMTITRQHAGCTAHLRVPFLASLCRCSSRNLPHSNTTLYL